MLLIQSGIIMKAEQNIHVKAAVTYYPLTENDFYQFDGLSKDDDLSWQPLSLDTLYSMFYLYILILLLIIAYQVIEIGICNLNARIKVHCEV